MKLPKILFIDIETSPNIVYSWTIGRKISLSYENIIEERQIICAAWKWSHHNKVYCADWKNHSDKHILPIVSKAINEADLIVAHNGDKYDIRFINGRLLFHDLPPIHHAKTEDTLKQLRKVFYFNSNKLDYISQFLGIGKKIKTNFNLWKEVMKGKTIALRNMIKYCKEDVRLLERLYNKVSAYVPQTLNKSLVQNGTKNGCSACGAGPSSLRPKGFRYNPKSIKQKYQCSICGKWSSF